jgi:hypothetical protein
VAFCANSLNNLPHFAGGARNQVAPEARSPHPISRKARKGA